MKNNARATLASFTEECVDNLMDVLDRQVARPMFLGLLDEIVEETKGTHTDGKKQYRHHICFNLHYPNTTTRRFREVKEEVQTTDLSYMGDDRLLNIAKKLKDYDAINKNFQVSIKHIYLNGHYHGQIRFRHKDTIDQ